MQKENIYFFKLQQVTHFSLVALFLAFPISLSLGYILMAWAFFLWLVSGHIASSLILLRSNPAACAALALFGVVMLGIFYGPAPWQDVQIHLEKYVKLIMVAVLFFLLANQPKWQVNCLNGFAAAMAFIAISSLLNVWLQLPWSETQNQGWGVNHHVVGDHITQNVMMSLFALLALLRIFSESDKIQKVLWISLFTIATISITHLSTGRTGYVLLASVLAVFVAVHFRGRTLIAAATATILATALVLLTSEVMQARIQLAWLEALHHQSDNTSSIGHRIYNLTTTSQMFLERPWLGWGTGAYHTEICRFIGNPDQCAIFSWHPHNQYLFLAANHGVLGLAIFLFFLISLAWQALRSVNHQAKVMLLGLCVLLFTNSLFNSPLWSARESGFFIFLAGLLLSMAWNQRQPAPPATAAPAAP